MKHNEGDISRQGEAEGRSVVYYISRKIENFPKILSRRSRGDARRDVCVALNADAKITLYIISASLMPRSYGIPPE